MMAKAGGGGREEEKGKEQEPFVEHYSLSSTIIRSFHELSPWILSTVL